MGLTDGGAPVFRVLLRVLVPPVCRALPWRALAVAGGLGLLLAGSTRLPDRTPSPETGLAVLRIVALAGVLGLAFLLDDPARHTTTGVPVRRPVRAGLRLALVAPLAALWWTAALFLIPAGSRPPAAFLTLEALGLAACALALPAIAIRFTREAEPGRGTAFWLGIATLAVGLVPDRWGLFLAEGTPQWGPAHVRWAVLLGVAAAMWAMSLPEPLRRRSIRLSPSGV
ncbi:ABC transporter [Streptomyces sp. NPDC002888]|uniref:ABC transporter n=1 Tax=Streptomyces sp. NPDC002888 TaxID=3364668 RepID=UPI00368EFA41